MPRALTLIKIEGAARHEVTFQPEVYEVRTYNSAWKQLTVVTTRYDSPLISMSKEELIKDFRDRGFYLEVELCKEN